MTSSNLHETSGKPFARAIGARLCAVAGCPARLRSDNTSGVCHPHKRLRGSCVTCHGRCDLRFTRCQACALAARQRGARGGNRPHPCKVEGCSELTRSTWGYCYDHAYTAHPCEVAGCSGRVAAWSRSRRCAEHRTGHRTSHAP